MNIAASKNDFLNHLRGGACAWRARTKVDKYLGHLIPPTAPRDDVEILTDETCMTTAEATSWNSNNAQVKTIAIRDFADCDPFNAKDGKKTDAWKSINREVAASGMTVTKTTLQRIMILKRSAVVCDPQGRNVGTVSAGVVVASHVAEGRVLLAAPERGWVDRVSVEEEDERFASSSSSSFFPTRGATTLHDTRRDVQEMAALALRSVDDAAAMRARILGARACCGKDVDAYDAAARHLTAADDADGEYPLDAWWFSRLDLALADALRAASLFGGEKLDAEHARAAAARIARTVAGVLALNQARGALPGLGLAIGYLEVAARWEPDARVADADERHGRVLESCVEKDRPRRSVAWRRQRCDPGDVGAARASAKGRCRAHATVVVGLGCGRCGSSSLAALLAACATPSAVTHECSLPDCRVVLWRSGDEEAARRRLDFWRGRDGVLVGDVNYAHLPSAHVYVEAGAKVVGLRRDREDTVRSFDRWTEPGGAPGSLASRDHWRDHDAATHQFDHWDLTFPKYNEQRSKLDAIYAYYDDYDAQLFVFKCSAISSKRRYGRARVRVFPSPDLFANEALQRELFDFLGISSLATPVAGIHRNAQL
ncbi:hypothetical protein CTAYLR_000311 [Chrysophaeum taylorii]|uniref:Uncharacterized protein n=1 Tax=Chrysophaeum taylorii TaxID=2483200 RepID=A0AAD7UF47_9STRA|nr:hypothetical protein CTAYLR_000311 [Chrysophaeum taylorii]